MYSQRRKQQAIKGLKNYLQNLKNEFDVDTCDIIADALQESGYILTDMGDTGLFLSQREEKDNLMMATEQMPVYKPDELEVSYVDPPAPPATFGKRRRVYTGSTSAGSTSVAATSAGTSAAAAAAPAASTSVAAAATGGVSTTTIAPAASPSASISTEVAASALLVPPAIASSSAAPALLVLSAIASTSAAPASSAATSSMSVLVPRLRKLERVVDQGVRNAIEQRIQDLKNALLQESTDQRLILLPEEGMSVAEVGHFAELCLQSEAGLMIRQLVATLRGICFATACDQLDIEVRDIEPDIKKRSALYRKLKQGARWIELIETFGVFVFFFAFDIFTSNDMEKLSKNDYWQLVQSVEDSNLLESLKAVNLFAPVEDVLKLVRYFKQVILNPHLLSLEHFIAHFPQ